MRILIAVSYASTTMRMWAGEALFLLNFFIVAPSISAAIGYAAWKGKPENFDRWLFWVVFFGAGVVAGFLMVVAQRMQADVRRGNIRYRLRASVSVRYFLALQAVA